MSYRRLLRWAALPITNRRMAAPLSAVALGFGLFVGVAIGPGASGTFGSGAAQVIEIPGFSGGTEEEEEEAVAGGGSGSPSAGTGLADGAGVPAPGSASESSVAEFVPTSSGEVESPQPEAEHSEPEAGAVPEEEEEVPEEQSLAGIVVHLNPAAGSYALAESGGTLNAVHAGKLPRPGTEVEVPVRLLANGTFAEAGTRIKSGSDDHASFDGIVTYVDPTTAAPAYAVSKRGVSVLVRVHPASAGATPEMPALGAFVSVSVGIEKPEPAPGGEPTQPPPAVAPTPSPASACAPDPAKVGLLPTFTPKAVLWQRKVESDGAPFTYGDFGGIVEAVCPATGQLLISADDIREGLRDLVLFVPNTIDTTGLQVGQSVTATATIGADGSLALSGLASDEHTKGADDPKATQGDLAVSPAAE